MPIKVIILVCIYAFIVKRQPSRREEKAVRSRVVRRKIVIMDKLNNTMIKSPQYHQQRLLPPVVAAANGKGFENSKFKSKSPSKTLLDHKLMAKGNPRKLEV